MRILLSTAGLAAAGLALALFAAVPANAQTASPTPASKWYVITGDVVGSTVSAVDDPNRTLGRLRGFVLSSTDGRAIYAIVDVGGFLGVGGTHVIIPYDLLAFSGQWDGPRLNVPSSMIATAPRTTDATIEQLLQDPNFRKSVADYYATVPRPAPTAKAAAAPAGTSVSFTGGWYTVEQAARGQQVFEAKCSTCHGPELGGGAVPALTGRGFLAAWSQRTIADLDGFEHTQMPLNAPGSLTGEDYVDLTSFILEKNGFPAGSKPLEPNERRALQPSPAALDRQQRLAANAPAAGAKTGARPAAAVTVKQPTTSGPTQAELLAADAATTYWLLYSKGLMGHRYSTLTRINSDNAAGLRVACVYQAGEVGSFQTGPVMYDGLAYGTTTHGTYAFDATTCRAAWSHQYVPTGPEVTNNSKGSALAGGRLIRGTQDGHLFALDAKTGIVLWDRAVMDATKGEFITAAPIVWNGTIFVGKAGGDWGIMGEMMAFKLEDGTKVWSRSLIPTGKEPGADSWKDPAAAKTGGGSTWSSYALDAATGTVFVPVGNPGPDFNNAVRPGSNHYTNSVVALDAASGALKWWYQLVANDFHDWDTSTVSLFDGPDGRKLVAAAGKDGVLHVLDRGDGSLVFKVPVTTLLNTTEPITPTGTRYCPGTVGGVEWNGPAYSPVTGRIYVNAVDWCVTSKLGPVPTYTPGEVYTGLKNGFGTFDPPTMARGWTNAVGVADGTMAWRFHSPTPMIAAVTPTAGNVLFTGDLNGNFLAMDSRTGDALYSFNTGGAIGGGVITYEVGGKQYVAVASGNASRTTWYTAGAASVFVFSQ